MWSSLALLGIDIFPNMQEVAEAEDDNDESWIAQQLSRSMGPLGAAQLPAPGSSAEPRIPSAGRTPPPGGLALAPRGQQAAQVAANGDRVLEVLHQGLHQIQVGHSCVMCVSFRGLLCSISFS